MNPQLQHLIDLQESDRIIEEYKGDLERIPKQVESARCHLEQSEKELAEEEGKLSALNKERLKLEQDVKEENDHMAKVKQKLPSVKTNKEYTAILAEVDSIKEKVSALEDRQLEIMETLETREQEIPAFKARVKEEEEKYGEYKAQKESERKRVEEELKQAQEKREGLIKNIEPKWAKHYEQVLKLRGSLAVVALDGNICLGCHQQILPQLAIEVKIGEKVFECIHCNRILYWVPKPEPESETAVPK